MDERSQEGRKSGNRFGEAVGVRLKKCLIDRGKEWETSGEEDRGRASLCRVIGGVISRWEGRETGTRGTAGEMAEIKPKREKGGESGQSRGNRNGKQEG